MEREEILAWCRELAFAGKDYKHIKSEVEAMDLSREEKIQILVKADEYLAHYQLALQERNKALQQMIMGAAFFFLGAGITFYTYFTLDKQYLLVYGLMLIGAWIAKEAYKVYQIPLEEHDNPLEQAAKRIKK